LTIALVHETKNLIGGALSKRRRAIEANRPYLA
jgi:hypothetical protein